MGCQMCQNKKNCPYLYIYVCIYKSTSVFINPHPDLYYNVSQVILIGLQRRLEPVDLS